MPHDPPVCPRCGEPIGVYELLWRVHPRHGAELTSWLHLSPEALASSESLWHKACAEGEGIDGG
jgi:hypothetical protein